MYYIYKNRRLAWLFKICYLLTICKQLNNYYSFVMKLQLIKAKL